MSSFADIVISFITAMIAAAFVHFGAMERAPKAPQRPAPAESASSFSAARTVETATPETKTSADKTSQCTMQPCTKAVNVVEAPSRKSV